MLVIPAIDIKDGRCVRLYQGEMERETVYFEDPREAASHWAAEGAERVHVVDLDGALLGRPVHLKLIEEICRRSGLAVQLGGGLRTREAVEAALAAGAERIVVGTAAYLDREWLRGICREFPGRIAVAIDARDGKVAIRGWKQATETSPLALARRAAEDGAARIIYTDIGRDGTGLGPNLEETARVAAAVRVPVIASGGVASLEDLRRLKGLGPPGVEAVIVGRALYAGAFTLREASSV